MAIGHIQEYKYIIHVIVTSTTTTTRRSVQKGGMWKTENSKNKVELTLLKFERKVFEMKGGNLLQLLTRDLAAL